MNFQAFKNRNIEGVSIFFPSFFSPFFAILSLFLEPFSVANRI